MMMIIALQSLFASTLIALPAPAHAIGPFRVVIDPGHGGTDFGTIFQNGNLRVTEKESTLLIAKEVARELRARRIQVTLTRDDDSDVALGTRTAIANRIKADLFLSIHMNSNPSIDASAEGIETFILNNTSNETSKRLARLENTVLGDTRADSDNLDVALILRDLRLDANLAESKRLACAVQDSLAGNGAFHPHFKSRGVKQALFHVLLGAEMPSALVEAGFLSNPRDRALVVSPKGRQAIGKAIALAIDQFRKAKGTPRATLALSRCKIH